MDLIVIVGVVSAGLLISVVVLVMLNRAWGDFPGRISGLPPAMSSRSTGPSPMPMAGAAPALAEMPEASPNNGLVPITHPMVRQAVAAALERGGSPYSLYFIRDGEEIYLVPTRIADPQQRELVTRMFTSLSNGGGESLPLGDIIRVMQELGKKK
jgi:hypothetical protein